MADSRGSRRQKNGPTFLALFALIGIVVGLNALTALVLPQIAAFSMVICGFVLLGTLQYMIWGYWMGRPSREDDPDAEQ
ncbi:MAG: hypothetical protein AB7O26_14230 [Planctomycetaceae bacterium]